MDEELIDYAYAYAIDALDLDERREVDKRLAASDSATHAEFDAQVRLTAETMAAMTVVDAVEPRRRCAAASLPRSQSRPLLPMPPFRWPSAVTVDARGPWLLRRPPQSQSWSAASESGARCPTTRRRRTPRPKSWQHPTFMPRRVKSRAAVVPRRCSRPPKTPQSS
ncbi:hypothetical protein ACETU7_34920 [Rhodococcus sp. 3Y1]